MFFIYLQAVKKVRCTLPLTNLFPSLAHCFPFYFAPFGLTALTALRSVLLKNNVVIIFDSTGPYSNYLKEFCAANQIKTCIINPKRSSNFAKAISNRSKTDKIDARTLYAFKNLIDSDDIKSTEIDKDVEVLSAYLSSYEFVLKIRISISNHIEALEHNVNAPKEVLNTLKQEFKRNKQLEGRLLNKTEKHIEKNGAGPHAIDSKTQIR